MGLAGARAAMNIRRIATVVSSALAALTIWISTSACEDDDCCPISETPSCSFTEYGGSRSLNGGVCPAYFDSAPASTVRKVDSNGCPYWEQGGRGSCGAASPRPPDAGSDTNESADSGSTEDGGHDADASDADATDAPASD